MFIQAINGCNPTNPLTPQQPILSAQHIVTTVIPLGPQSTHMICKLFLYIIELKLKYFMRISFVKNISFVGPSCGCEVETKTKTTPGLIAYISGFLLAALGCWFGCCLIPCCIDECMDVHHQCPSCGTYLGRHRR